MSDEFHHRNCHFQVSFRPNESVADRQEEILDTVQLALMGIGVDAKPLGGYELDIVDGETAALRVFIGRDQNNMNLRDVINGALTELMPGVTDVEFTCLKD
jgi:hypothetical protein